MRIYCINRSIISHHFSYYAATIKVRGIPPKYLAIEGFKACLSSEPRATWIEVCIPPNRPYKCLEKSWKELNDLGGTEEVSSCRNQGIVNTSTRLLPASSCLHSYINMCYYKYFF